MLLAKQMQEMTIVLHKFDLAHRPGGQAMHRLDCHKTTM